MTDSAKVRERMEQVIDFLCGSGELDGEWYGAFKLDKPTFWWRTALRAAWRDYKEALHPAQPVGEQKSCAETCEGPWGRDSDHCEICPNETTPQPTAEVAEAIEFTRNALDGILRRMKEDNEKPSYLDMTKRNFDMTISAAQTPQRSAEDDKREFYQRDADEKAASKAQEIHICATEKARAVSERAAELVRALREMPANSVVDSVVVAWFREHQGSLREALSAFGEG